MELFPIDLRLRDAAENVHQGQFNGFRIPLWRMDY